MNEVLRLARLRHGKKGCGHYRYAERKSVIVCRGCGERFEGDRAATRALQHIKIDRRDVDSARAESHVALVKESIADDRRETWARRWTALWYDVSPNDMYFPRRRSLLEGLRIVVYSGLILIFPALIIVRLIARAFS